MSKERIAITAITSIGTVLAITHGAQAIEKGQELMQRLTGVGEAPRSAVGSPAYLRPDGQVETPDGLAVVRASLPTLLENGGVVTDAQACVITTPADKSGDAFVIRHPDEDKTEARVLPAGFAPDKSLHFATDIKPLDIGSDLKPYQDWETALNTKRPAGPLAGYNYDYNDFCQTGDFRCNVQGDMFAWRTFQGEEVEVPGVGRLEGGPRRSVLFNLLNLDGSVHAWDNEKSCQVRVKRGFTATGRIFDGQKNVDVLERNLSGHWLFRQAFGTPENSYTGITDSPDNAKEVLVVSVQRKQWGLNPDGSKRMKFQLIRAELVKVK